MLVYQSSPELEDSASVGRTMSSSAVSEDETLPSEADMVSPSYSRGSTVESNGTAKGAVTIAMLRALAQGVLKSKP